MRGPVLLLALLASTLLLEQAKAADKSFQLKDAMKKAADAIKNADKDKHKGEFVCCAGQGSSACSRWWRFEPAGRTCERSQQGQSRQQQENPAGSARMPGPGAQVVC